jgi:hypothetical protein
VCFCLAIATATQAEEIALRVVEEGQPDRGVRSYIDVDGEEWDETDPTGAIVLEIDECTRQTEIRARPFRYNYAYVTIRCKNGPRLLESRKMAVAQALREDQVGKPPYAEALLAAIEAPAEELAALGEDAAELQNEMVAAFDAGDFSEGSRRAFTLATLAERAQSPLVGPFALLATDAGLRATGLDPARAEAPLLVAAENTRTGYMLTDEGLGAIDLPGIGLAAGLGVRGTMLHPMVAEMKATDLVGQTVVDAKGTALGTVAEIVRTTDGVGAVVEVGGFLGMGEKPVALDVKDLTFRNDMLSTGEITAGDIEAAPDYEGGGEMVPQDVPLGQVLR